ncbi:hypothetical protein J4E91_006349 [Alternaria rosae]|nr:hypothetical protein J4E91_006349 [Alternaria rosae]
MANHRAMQEMSRLEDLQLQRELKQSVLEYIIDMYQPAYPNNHGFSILICRHMFDRSSSIPAAAALGRRNDREEFIMIRAVTLREPGTKKWTLVAESSKAYFGIIPALQEFTKDLEREMGNMTASMTVDNKRRRNERDEGSIDQGGYMSGRSRKRQRDRAEHGLAAASSLD